MIFRGMVLIEVGVIWDRWVAYNADHITRFRHYWDLLVERRKKRPETTMLFNAIGCYRYANW